MESEGVRANAKRLESFFFLIKIRATGSNNNNTPKTTHFSKSEIKPRVPQERDV